MSKITELPSGRADIKTSLIMENKLVVAKGEWGGSGMSGEFGGGKCKPLHLEWISNEILL